MIRVINGLSMVNQRPMLVTKGPCVFIRHLSFVKPRLAAHNADHPPSCLVRGALWPAQYFVIGGYALAYCRNACQRLPRSSVFDHRVRTAETCFSSPACGSARPVILLQRAGSC